MSPTILDNSEIVRFYANIRRVAAFRIRADEAITQTRLSGVDLLVLPTPHRSFSPLEVGVIEDFLNGDGTVFAIGESIPSRGRNEGNPRINAMLEEIGSSMRINSDNLDLGNQVALGERILSHPLTDGVSRFSYGATASLSGGTPLILTTGDLPFIAVESFPIPEPNSCLLLLIGLLGVFTNHRGRRPLN